MAIETGIFNTSFRDVVILVSSRQENRMSGIFIYDRRKKDEPKVLIAKEGRVQVDNEQNLGLYMSDGYIHIAKPEGSVEVFFERYNLLLNLRLEGPSRKNSEMTPFELLKSARESKTGERVSLFLEFHRHLSFPALCLYSCFWARPVLTLRQVRQVWRSHSRPQRFYGILSFTDIWREYGEISSLPLYRGMGTSSNNRYMLPLGLQANRIETDEDNTETLPERVP